MTRATSRRAHSCMSCQVFYSRSSSFVARAMSMMQLLKALTSCRILSKMFVACPALACFFPIQLEMCNPCLFVGLTSCGAGQAAACNWPLT